MIPFNAFCQNPNETCRQYLSAPFNFKNYTVSTDAYRVLFSPQCGDYPTLEQLDSPLTNAILQYIIDDKNAFLFKPLPQIDWPATRPCTACKGTKNMLTLPCTACGGKGFADKCELIECDVCDGEGLFHIAGHGCTCTYCHGTGTEFVPNKASDRIAAVEIYGAHFKAEYIAAITSHAPLVCLKKYNHALYFKAGQQFGVILGLAV